MHWECWLSPTASKDLFVLGIEWNGFWCVYLSFLLYFWVLICTIQPGLWSLMEAGQGLVFRYTFLSSSFRFLFLFIVPEPCAPRPLCNPQNSVLRFVHILYSKKLLQWWAGLPSKKTSSAVSYFSQPLTLSKRSYSLGLICWVSCFSAALLYLYVVWQPLALWLLNFQMGGSCHFKKICLKWWRRWRRQNI